MSFFPGQKMSKTNAQADLKSLKFSMCIYMYPNSCSNAGIFDIRYSWMRTYGIITRERRMKLITLLLKGLYLRRNSISVMIILCYLTLVLIMILNTT